MTTTTRAWPESRMVVPILGLMACVSTSGLAAQGTVRGIVRLSNGTRAPGVTVEVLGYLPTAATNDTGGYVIPGVPAGTYAVRAEAPSGVQDSALGVVVAGGSTAVVDLWLGPRPANWAELADSVPLGAGAQPGLLLLYLDSLAVTMVDVTDSGSARTRDSVEASGLMYAGDGSGVMTFAVPAPLLGDTLALRDSAFARAARLRRDLPGLVRQAGPVARLGAGGSPLVATNEVVVELAGGLSAAVVRGVAASVGATAPWRVPVGSGRYLMRALDNDGPALANRLMALSVGGPVLRAHAHFRARASANWASPAPQGEDQWHLKAVNVAGAEARIQASGIPPGAPLIAVIEGGGIDVSHPAFPASVSGWNFQACDEEPPPWPGDAPPPTIPPCGSSGTASGAAHARHGPPVAALAVTKSTASAVRGICTGCGLLPVVYAGDSPTQAGWAIEWAQLVKNADIISWSWVTELPVGEIQLEAPGLLAAVQSAAAAVPLVLGAGNLDFDPCQAQWLQSIQDVIVVGASNHRDYGIPAAHGSCLDLLAPGGRGGFLGVFPPTGRDDMTGIVTADLPDGGYNPGCSSDDYEDLSYTRCFGGTSAAAPIVAGVLGLMKQVDPGLPAVQARDYLQQSTDHIDKLRAGYDDGGYSLTHGYGRVNACAAVAMTLVTAPAGCEVDLFPSWIRALAVLAVLLVVTAFIVSGILLGWCHWLTWILGALAAGVVAFTIASCLSPTIRRWRLWIAIGAMAVALLIFLVVCL